jgi:uncharacterized protein YjiS (DUF1127 family)
MLTLVRQQPRTATVSWDKVIRLGRRASEQVAVWHSQRRELDALSRLDDHLLADIGLTREQHSRGNSKCRPARDCSGGPVIEIFGLIARPSTMLIFSGGAADVL